MLVEKASYFQRITDSFRNSWLPRQALLQVAALCYRLTDTGHEILLITSRGRGAWILPKGWPKSRLSSAETALEEAFEEAGIRGRVIGTSIGQYHYTKSTSAGAMLECVATVHEVALIEIAPDFPEKGERQVQWFSPEAAAQAVTNSELADILLKFKPSV